MEPASLAVILDSSIIIAAERREHTVRQILEQVRAAQGEISVSVVTIAELVHGAYRAKTQSSRIDGWSSSSDVPVHSVTLEIAPLAGRIEGQQEAKGVQLAFEDLLIGVTALHLGYNVATLNVRDFQRVPAPVGRATVTTAAESVSKASSPEGFPKRTAR